MSKTLVNRKLSSGVLLNYFRALNVEKIYLIFWWRWYFLGTFSYNKLLLEVWMHICVSHNKIPPRSLNSIWWWPACITVISNLLSSRCCVAWLRRMFKMSSTHNWLPELVFSCLPCRALSSHAKWSESWVYIWIWSSKFILKTTFYSKSWIQPLPAQLKFKHTSSCVTSSSYPSLLALYPWQVQDKSSPPEEQCCANTAFEEGALLNYTIMAHIRNACRQSQYCITM